MLMRDAIDVVINKIEELGIGKRKVNYKMRDAASAVSVIGASRFQLSGMMGLPYPLDENELPLELPHVDKYGPGPRGKGRLRILRSG